MAPVESNNNETSASASTLTPSEVLVADFLAANPQLSDDLGAIQVDEGEMTDRYTNDEWAAQIKETVKKVKVPKEGDDKKAAALRFKAPRGGKELAKTIDHTLLKLEARESQIDALCSEARTEGFRSVCVRLNFVQRCVSNLKGTDILVACVIGFHEGTQDTYYKLKEARAAVAAGASELDIVLNHSILTQPPNPEPIRSPTKNSSHRVKNSDSTIESLTASNTAANRKPGNGDSTPVAGPYAKSVSNSTINPSGGHSRNTSGSTSSTTSTLNPTNPIPNYSAIYTELASLRSICPPPITLKLILETSQLSPPQILAASHLAAAANFDFIKTSTGFNGRGATLQDVQLMVAAAEYLSTKNKSNGNSPVRSRKMQVKASGGIRGLGDAVKMLEAGATRLGSSSGVWIMQESRKAGERKGKGDAPGMTRLYTDESVY